jgi:arylsulfatase A-like enzyme
MKKERCEHPNIILIVIDALRARNLGYYSGNVHSSPNIDKIAENSALFENCYACWNTTDQSLTSILTGRHPRTHGIVHHGDKITSEDLKTFDKLNVKLLAEILQQIGYRTLAIDWMGRWFKRGFDYYGYTSRQRLLQKLLYRIFVLPRVHLNYMLANIGLLRIYAKKRRSSIRSSWKGLRDVFNTFRFTFELARIQDAGHVTRLAAKLINQLKNENFFLFLHYWDTHSPYNCPKKYMPMNERSRNPIDRFLLKYQGAVNYIDHNIGKLLNVLKEKKLMENTLFILTSDHGESLTEHDIFFDHHGLYDETTHVPLILHNAKIIGEAKRITGFVQHIDLAPTLCDLLDIEDKKMEFDGRSLLPLIKGEKEKIRDFAFNEESYVQRKIGLRTSHHKYIFAPDGIGKCNYCQKVHAGPEELYSLDNDPKETVNRIREDKRAAGMMRHKVNDLIKKLDAKRRRELNKGYPKKKNLRHDQDSKEEKKIRKKLRSLGYIE